MAEKSVLVIGGGISGITAAIEAAESGYDVHLVEKNPYLGGRVAQLNKYFPKLCPPICGIELNLRRVKENPAFNVYTMAEVESITGSEGDYKVSLKLNARHVNDRCTACDACAEACPAERDNEFNLGMDKTKAAYLPFNQAFPARYVIDRKNCQSGCGEPCKAACKYDAIELDDKGETKSLEVGAVVLATGWNPYDATKMDNLSFGKVKNVVTNMMMERLAAVNGPTGGKIVRPSDGKEAKKVAFVQCAGSRDENHLEHCSYICCMASLKQAMYVREQYPDDSNCEVFYIDLRTPGRYEAFLNKAEEDEKIALTKGKVARIEEDPATGDVVVELEEVLSGVKRKDTFDMVVLAAGMEPSTAANKAAGFKFGPKGFVDGASLGSGMYAVGSTKSPVDVSRSVQDATGVALKTIQSLRR